MRDPARILIVAPNWLGDAVMALPAIEDVRRRSPNSRLTIAARPAIAPLFRMVPSVEEVVELESRGGMRDLAGVRHDAARLRAIGADVALLLPNSFASALVVRIASIPQRWGYNRDGRRLLLTRAVPRPAQSVHQGVYYQRLVQALGMANGPLEPRVIVPEHALAEARALLARNGWDGTVPLVVLAPGAAYGTAKQWLPEHFARLAAAVIRDRGAHCALVGSGADAETNAAILSVLPDAIRERASDLSGRTSLPALAGVMALAQACVSNDSGAMHMAAAVGVPLAAIFGPTNERETSPLARSGVPVEILINPVSCRPCMLRECPIDHRCMRDLEPARVAGSVYDLLARRPHPETPGPSRS